MVLSMDLSLSSPAFAVLEYDNNGTVKLIHKSHVNNKKRSKATHGERLSYIYDELNRIMEKYPIKETVREKGFSRYAQTTQTLFKVVGISDFITHRMAGLTVSEIPPTTIKKVLAGHGFSSKDAVAEALYAYIGKQDYANDDESDAVAVGIVYLMQKGIVKKAS